MDDSRNPQKVSAPPVKGVAGGGTAYGWIDSGLQGSNPHKGSVDPIKVPTADLVHVCVNKHGILLNVVQVLAEVNIIITKAYISSDGVWFMDVFNVIDQNGKNKIRDTHIINYIQMRLESNATLHPHVRDSVGVMPSE